MKIDVEGNIERALRVLKKKMLREGIFREMKQRGRYEKPSERRTRLKRQARERTRRMEAGKAREQQGVEFLPHHFPGLRMARGQ